MVSASDRATSRNETLGRFEARVQHRSRRKDVLLRFMRHKAAMAGVIVLLLLIITAVFAPIIAPYDPIAVSRDNLESPSTKHLMGTDHIGRDIFSRIIYGARISLQMGIVAVLIGTTVGTIIGLVAGFYGGMTDNLLMRIIDAMMAFPSLLLALSIAAILGSGLFNAMIAVGISWIPQFARLVRASVLQVRVMPYVDAARAAGCTDLRLMTRHIFGNVTTPILVLSTLGIASAILIGASLSFLGLGSQPPTPEWGAILSQGRQFMRQAWWIMTFPGLAITITVMAANLFGDGLRDALDPKLKL